MYRIRNFAAVSVAETAHALIRQLFQSFLRASHQIFLFFLSAFLCTALASEAYAASAGCNAATSTTVNSGNTGTLANNLLFDSGDIIAINVSGGPTFTATIVNGTTTGTVTNASATNTFAMSNNDFTTISVLNSSALPETVSYSCTTNGQTAAAGVAPIQGTTAGGTPVTIIGANFVGATAVSWDGSPIAFTVPVTSPPGTTISITTPPHALGKVSVAVTGADGVTSTASNVFEYVQSATTTTIVGVPNPSSDGNVTFTATVSATGGGTPTGTVDFKVDGGPATTVTVSGGTAVFTPTPALTAGNHTITAAYSGDPNFKSSTGTLQEQVLAATNVVLGSSLNPSTYGQSVTFTATVTGSSPLGSPTGFVSFYDNSNLMSGTASQLSAGGVATFTLTSLTGGTHSITAKYTGDANFNPGTSNTVTQTVNSSSTTTLVSSANPNLVGQPVTFTATVTGNGGTPSGTVTFTNGATPLGTITLVAGQAAVTTSALGVGAQPITATYNGDTTFVGSSASLTQNETSSTTTTLVSSVNPSAVGQAVTFTATVTGSAGTPTGTVTFKDGATVLANAVALSPGGVATLTTSALVGGVHNLTATYNGDNSNAPSTGPLTQNVTTNSVTAVVSSLNPSTVGQAVTFTATVTGTGGTPSGTVTFKDGATTLGSITLVAGKAAVTTSALPAGQQTITATYSGDTSFGSSSGTVVQDVQSNSTTTLTSSINPSALNQSVTFTATVTGSGVTPTGTVLFMDGSVTLAAAVTLSPGGVATFATSTLTSGSHTIKAVYSGDTNYVTSSATVVQNVQSATTTTLTSSLNPSQFGQAVTFTATVTGNPPPTGTVTFKDGATTLGAPVALNAGGTAALTISTLSIGNHPITATYNGNGINLPSTSAVLTQAVNVPADSVKLRALQVTVTKIEAQGAGQAISGAIDSAIGEGFADDGQLVTPSDTGMHINFAAETEDKPTLRERVGGAFDALGYAADPIIKAQPRLQPKEWLAWADVRDIGFNTSSPLSDLRGSQLHALGGLTHRFGPDFLVGMFGGYETADYTSQSLAGRLKGSGWTVGGYAGWRLAPGLRFDAGVARSGISYDGTAGSAEGQFPGSRWLATGGLTGTLRAWILEIEPSARVYALWEHEKAYTDSLGTAQAERDFSTGRASVGTKLAAPLPLGGLTTLSPYIGAYADYYMSTDNATAFANAGVVPVPPSVLMQGFAARVTSGLSLGTAGGAKISVGGELGGLGNDFQIWTVRGRLAVPF
jgi:hypothetical protein